MSTNIQINTPTSLEDAYLTNENYYLTIKTSSKKNIWFNENMSKTFEGCSALNYDFINSPFNFSSVTNMYRTFFNCYNQQQPINSAIRPQVTNLVQTYYNCVNLSGDGHSGSKVTNMYQTYYNCGNLNGTGYIDNAVTGTNRYYQTFYRCNNLTGLYLNATDMTDFFTSAFTNNAISNLSNIKKITFGDGCSNIYAAMRYANTLTNPILSIGNNTINMVRTFENCFNMTSNPVSGNNVKDMFATYIRDYNITGNGACGPNVINFAHAYQDCRNLNGHGFSGPNVTNMYQTYYNCGNLAGIGYIEKSVTGTNCFLNTFYRCNNLTGLYLNAANIVSFFTSAFCNNVISNLSNIRNITIGGGCTNASTAMRYANTLRQVNLSVSDTITNLSYAFADCYNMTSQPATGKNVVNMHATYYLDYNITGEPVCAPNVTDFRKCYQECRNLTGNAVCGNKVTNAYRTYYNCTNLNGTAYVGDSIAAGEAGYNQMFYNCCNFTAIYLNAANIASFFVTAFGGNTVGNLNNVRQITVGEGCNISAQKFMQYASSLTNVNIKIGNNVPNLYYAFQSCYNMVAYPKCGPNVTDFRGAYERCYNLIGEPVCGDKVTNMFVSYNSCHNITGNAICGPKVTNMYRAYYNCFNLNGFAVAGPALSGANCVLESYKLCNNLTGIYYDMTTPEAAGWLVHATGGNTVTNLSNVHTVEFGPNCTNAYYVCRYGTTLRNINIILHDSITHMNRTFQRCYNLLSPPKCGNSVTYFDGCYEGCYNMLGEPACGPNVTSMRYTYQHCRNLTGSVELAYSLINMYSAFNNTANISTIVLPNKEYLMANANFNLAFKRAVYNTRLNVLIGNLATYKNMRASTLAAGCSFTATNTNVDISSFNINGNIYIPTQYCYNTAQNIYLYCLS